MNKKNHWTIKFYTQHKTCQMSEGVFQSKNSELKYNEDEADEGIVLHTKHVWDSSIPKILYN